VRADDVPNRPKASSATLGGHGELIEKISLRKVWMKNPLGTLPLGNGAAEYLAQGVFFPRLCKFFPARQRMRTLGFSP
jgi:hypothetical protein